MADATSNTDAVMHHLANLVHALDLDCANAAGQGTLGDAIFDEVAVAIRAEAIDGQRSPDGTAFEPLTERYAIRKQREHGFVAPIGVATGAMLAPEQLRGERAIGDVEATMTYGTDAENRAKMDGFSRKRPVFGLSPAAAAAADRVVDAHLTALLGG